MNTPIADKIYKKEVVRLVKKLPFNVGVKFSPAINPEDPCLHVTFRFLSGEQDMRTQLYVMNHKPPADYLVREAAFRITEELLKSEDDDS